MNKRVYLLAFASGWLLLQAEVVWSRVLRTILGSSALAVSAVLLALMTGLAAGYFLSKRMVRRIGVHALLRCVLLLQLASCTAVVFGFYLLSRSALFTMGGPVFNLSVRYVVCLLLLLLACLVAGMALPVLQQCLPACRFARLYLAYNLGALAGALLTAFWLIRSLGLLGAPLASALGALLIMLAVLPFMPAGRLETERPQGHAADGGRYVKQVLLLCGFVALSMEFLFTRVLAVLVSNNTYSFSIILATYIASICAGSLLFAGFSGVRRVPPAYWLLGLSAVLCLAAVSLPGLGTLYRYMAFTLGNPLLRVLFPCFLLSVLLFAPCAVLLNLAFLAAYQRLAETTDKQRLPGMALGLSTVGSIAGILLCLFVLLPLLGAGKTILLMAGVALAPAAGAAAGKHLRAVAISFAAVVLALLIVLSLPVYPPSVKRTNVRDDEVLMYQETLHGNLTVVRDKRNDVIAAFVDNNVIIGTSYDALKAVEMLALVPLLYNPAPRNALVIGYGMGVTTGILARHVSGTLDSVEIVPKVYDLSPYFARVNNQAGKNPRIRRHAMDGRIFLAVTPEEYAVISCDPTHPLLGSNTLYTREFFQSVYAHLPESGLVSQYIPLHNLSNRSLLSLLKTMAGVFDDMSLWLAYTHLVVVGHKGKTVFDFHNLSRLDTAVRAQVRKRGLYNLASLASLYVCNKADLAPYLTQDIAVNSDWAPHVEFDTFFNKSRQFKRNFTFILSVRRLPAFVDGPGQDRLKQAFHAKTYMFKALLEENSGKLTEALALVEEGLRLDSSDLEMRNFYAFTKKRLERLRSATPR